MLCIVGVQCALLGNLAAYPGGKVSPSLSLFVWKMDMLRTERWKGVKAVYTVVVRGILLEAQYAELEYDDRLIEGQQPRSC